MTTTVHSLVRTALRDAIVEGVHPVDSYSVHIKQGLDTALWIWKPPHRIYVGDLVVRRMRSGLSEQDQDYYVANYLMHEFSHAQHTHRDMQALKDMIARVGCSFGLLNLMEDARIEDLWRAKTGRPFRWLDFEEPSVDFADTAERCLFSWIQIEGKGLSTKDPDGLLEKVEPFYRKAILAPTTLALEPILAEWLAVFGDVAENDFRFAGGMASGQGELALMASLSVDTQALSDFEGSSVEIGAKSEPLEETVIAVEADEGELLGENESEVDESAARRHASRLRAVMTTRARSFYVEQPNARLCAWRADVGRNAYRRRDGERLARRFRSLVVDCSGSMDGEHIKHARTLVRSLSLLAEYGALEGQLILSAIEDGRALSQSITWPVSIKQNARIHAFGSGEGIQDAIERHATQLQRAEKIYVFTDGAICDRPLNLSSFRRRGVEVIGLYVGDEASATERLKKHFDRFAARETLDGLIEFLFHAR